MYPHHFESPNFFGDHALLPSCFRRWCIWKQKILPSEIHELLQWDAGAPEGIRTPDPQIRSLVLYPAELPAQLQEKGGPPEEIRTPDPQIRSLIIFNSLTFLHFP